MQSANQSIRAHDGLLPPSKPNSSQTGNARLSRRISDVHTQERRVTRKPQHILSSQPLPHTQEVNHARHRKNYRLVASIIGGVLCVVFLVWIIQHNEKQSHTTTDTNDEVVQDLEYQTILPSNKSISELGGWTRISPDRSEPVYAYADTIGSVSISVSQQPLPRSFIGNTDVQISELAKKFNATKKLDAGGITLYIGASTQGPQSVIFTKNSLLILIKSQKAIEDAAWIRYVKSLS